MMNRGYVRFRTAVNIWEIILFPETGHFQSCFFKKIGTNVLIVAIILQFYEQINQNNVDF